MPDREATEEAVAALAAACEQAVTAVTRTNDDDDAFRAASDISKVLMDTNKLVKSLRDQLARRIYEKNALTLRALADRIGVSKTRAGQFVDNTKTTKEGEPS